MTPILCTSYGSNNSKKGIAIITREAEQYVTSLLPLPGKCNFAIEQDGILYVPVQTESPILMEFLHDGTTYSLLGAYPVSHFYSHGVFFQGSLILASFSDGVDAIYDVGSHREIDVFLHEREGYSITGRSHYVGVTPDHNHVYSVDNALQQIQIYEVKEGRLVVVSTMEFGDENIRLMPQSHYSDRFYLNTEISNKLYVLRYENMAFSVEYEEPMEHSDKCFSGGNGISEDGTHLVITLRGDNFLQYYRIEKDGSLKLLARIPCGEMPRDVLFHKDRLYVACTGKNAVEVYRFESEMPIHDTDIPIAQPITFAVR
ncbi:MAG: beta-propeller fold lactonase family protein [Solobacterium sp.]|nr:beta-propeller fold lactonase family protein [Solobacterium sp.]